MNDPDQAVSWPIGMDDDLPLRLSAFHESLDIEDRPLAGIGTGLVSLGYIGSAVWRRARLWLALAIVGLVVGAGYAIAFPSAYSATVSVILVDDPNQNPIYEVQTDTALAKTIPVATAAVRQLGLQETPTDFLGTYSISAVTQQVLTISAKGKTSAAAVQAATAVATQFLAYRASYQETRQQQTVAQLNQQVAQAQQRADSINSQITQASAQPSTPAQQANLANLRSQETAAENTLGQVQAYATQTQASTQTVTQAMVRGSRVLSDAMPAKRSGLKDTLLYAAIGLFGGMAVGMIIVILGAITSDRLRRRDDIASAVGAPVRLSVGALRAPGLRLELPGRRAARRRSMERVVSHLRNAVPGSSKGPAGLAVVAVDDGPTAAKALVGLAVSTAKQGKRVVLADLSDGARAGALLKAKAPGINKVDADGARILVVVPAKNEVAPIGPLQSHASPDGYAQADAALVAACEDADVLLSLVALDPAHGGEHLATWATEAVALVTAGKSSAVRIHAVGEMVRLSGTRLASVVVVAADKSDESLGLSTAL